MNIAVEMNAVGSGISSSFQKKFCKWNLYSWLVVSTHLKNISQIGNLPQIGVKIINIWNHHLDSYWSQDKFAELHGPNLIPLPASLHLKFLRQCSGKGHSNVQSFTIGKTITFIDLETVKAEWKSLWQISAKTHEVNSPLLLPTACSYYLFLGQRWNTTQIQHDPTPCWWLRHPAEKCAGRTNHLPVALVGVKISILKKHLLHTCCLPCHKKLFVSRPGEAVVEELWQGVGN